MWFKIISYILAAMALVKLGVGLGMGDQFFGWARKEYGRERPSGLITGVLTFTFLLAVITWYATLTHYVPYGWILTLIMTLIGVYAMVILFYWKKIAPMYVPLIGKFEKKRPLWYTMGMIWTIVFLMMGLFLY